MSSNRCRVQAAQASSWSGQDDIPNLNQMIDAVSRDGFVIAQEYLKAAEAGRHAFVRHERPTACASRDRYAAFRRVRRAGGDMRSNIHAGGYEGRGSEIDSDRFAESPRLSVPNLSRTECSWLDLISSATN